MKAYFLTADKSENLDDQKKFLYLPVILSCQFENFGQFNIVLMRPDGVGSSFYGGWAKPGKINRNWTLPVHEKELAGVWQVVIVLRTKDGSVDHLSLEGELTDGIKPISQKLAEEVPFQMKFPVKDITIPYPTLWISGKSSVPFELTIKDKLYNIVPDASNNFLMPFNLEFGSYSLIDIVGGSGTPKFNSSYSIFSIKGSFDSSPIELKPIKITKSFKITRDERTIPLDVTIPALDNKTSNNRITIDGKTDSKATLLINGKEIITKKGKFSEDINLKDGDNEIAFTLTSGTMSHDERILITKIADKPLFVWDYPVEDLISNKKFQLIKGWAGINSEIVIDGNKVPLTPIQGYQNIGEFTYDYPIRIGINEIEIVVQNEFGTARESRFIECDIGKLSFNFIKKPLKVIKTFDTSYHVKAQVTTGSKVIINGKYLTPGLHGEIDTKIDLSTVGTNEIQIELEKSEIFTDEYPPIRSGTHLITDIKYLNDRQSYYLSSKNILSIKDFFTYHGFYEDIKNGLIEIDQVYQLQKYIGFLLLSKNSLALFTDNEAYLLSLTEIRSIEELVSMDPFELVSTLNKLADDHNIEVKFVIGDANRWQRTLDDLLFEFQEEFLS